MPHLLLYTFAPMSDLFRYQNSAKLGDRAVKICQIVCKFGILQSRKWKFLSAPVLDCMFASKGWLCSLIKKAISNVLQLTVLRCGGCLCVYVYSTFYFFTYFHLVIHSLTHFLFLDDNVRLLYCIQGGAVLLPQAGKLGLKTPPFPPLRMWRCSVVLIYFLMPFFYEIVECTGFLSGPTGTFYLSSRCRKMLFSGLIQQTKMEQQLKFFNIVRFLFCVYCLLVVFLDLFCSSNIIAELSGSPTELLLP